MIENSQLNPNSAAWEDAIVEIAQTRFKDAWDLSLATEDDELFQKVWAESLRIAVDDVIASLIDKGVVEVSAMTESGDMLFGLTPAGEIAGTQIIERNINNEQM